MKKIITSLFLIFLACNLYAQNEGNIWYFGNYAGLDFNGGGPTPLTNGQVNTEEGCATICDQAGSLLFYTDGVTVYDRTHSVMMNGDSLMGHFSSTQSGIIVPKPMNPFIYYIFTVDDKTRNRGFRYSIVDLTLNGGLGAVTADKNILLSDSTTEKVTAVKHVNNRDIWVIMHDWLNNTFKTFLVTSDGINGIENTVPGYPVITPVGTVHSGSDYNKIGYLKVSPEGDKIALTMFDSDVIEIFDFDNSTGIISNPYTMQSSASYGSPYGVEFSPDGTRLYITIMSGNSPMRSRLYQFDLTASDIEGSRVMLANLSTINQYGALQLAPDQKIYVARFNQLSLGVINDPDALGAACNFTDLSQGLAGRISKWGLPTFIQSFFTFDIVAYSNTPICVGEDIYLSCDTIFGATYAWTGPNGFTSTEQNPIITNATSANSGDYIVTATLMGVSKSDTVTVLINPSPIANAGPDQTICVGGTVSLGELATGGSAPYIYLWEPADWLSATDIYNPDCTPLGDTTYILTVTDINGCVDYDTVEVKVLDPLIEFPDGDTLDFGVFCANDTKDSTFRIRNGSTFETTFIVDETGLSSYFNVTGVIDDRQFNINEIRNLDISFTGSAVPGSFLDSIKIVDTCGNTKTIFLKAEVKDINIDVTPDTLDFGLYCVDATKDSTFSIENLSSVATIVTADLSGVSSLFTVDISGLATQFAIGETRVVPVTFNGTSVAGNYLDSVRIINECGGIDVVYLKVEIYEVVYGALPDTIDFGIFCGATTKDTSLTFQNLSGREIDFSAQILPDPNPHFEFIGDAFGTPYADGESRVIDLRYLGSGFTGVYVDSLKISDECGGSKTVILKAERSELELANFPDTITICSSNDTTKIRYDIVAGNPPYTFLWTPATGLDNATIKEPTIITPSDITYYVTVSDGAGCSVDDSVKVLPYETPNLEFDPDTLDFGEIDSCETSKDMTLIIRNLGTYDVTLTDTSTNPAFTVQGGHTRTIPGGGSVVVTVKFVRSDATGTIATGKLFFTSQQCGDVFEVDLKATIKGETIAISKAGIDFGNHPDCEEAEVVASFMVYNRNTTLPAELGSPQYAPNTGAYTVTSPTSFPYTIAPGDSVEIVVKYTPPSSGTHNSTLMIPFTLGECINNISVDLTGMQFDVGLSSDRYNVDFGALSGCEDTVSAYVTITNTGSTKINSLDAITDGNIELIQSQLDAIENLNPGESRLLKLLFRPDDNGTITGTITLKYQPCDEEIVISYTGSKNGVNFNVTDTVDFGEFCFVEGLEKTGNLIVTNISEGELDGAIKDMQLTGDFSDADIATTDIKIGDDLINSEPNTYTVSFTPEGPGEYFGTIDLMLDPCDIVKSVVLKANVTEIYITGMPDTLTMCHNVDTVKIRCDVVGGSDYTYQWSPATGLDDPTLKEPTIIEPADITYELTVTDASGCVASETVTVRYRPAPELDFSETLLDFGVIDSCEISRDFELEITNNGQYSVTLADSSDNASFEVLGSHTRTIKPNETVTVVIRFIRSDEAGGTVVDGKLYFYSAECGDYFELDMTVQIKGESVAISDPNLVFGTLLDCDTTEHIQTFTIVNRNRSLETVLNIFQNLPLEHFRVIKPETFPVVVESQDSVVFEIAYEPKAVGDHSADLMIPFIMEECDDTIRIRLSGSYIESILVSDVNNITFANLTGCEDRDTAYITLSNTGSANISSITAEYDDNIFIDPEQLELKSELLPGESIDLTVVFTPNSNEVFSDEINFVYEPCSKNINIPYTGSKNGINFEVTDVIDFGEFVLCKDSPRYKDIMIRNISDGDQEGTLASISVSGDFDDNTVSTNGLILNDNLPVDELKEYMLSFAPDVPGTYQGRIELVLEPCSIKKTILLKGSATDVSFEALEELVSDSIMADTLWTRDIVFRNNGTDTITVNKMSGLSAPFKVEDVNPPLDAVLLPGEEIVVSVSFQSNDDNNYTTELELSGTQSCNFEASTIISLGVEKLPMTMTMEIPCPLDTVAPGYSVVAPLIMKNVANFDPTGLNEFEAVIRFNKTLLQPYGVELQSDLTEDGLRQITFRAEADFSDTSGMIYPLKFFAALGNIQCTDLELLSFKWIDSEVTVDSLIDGCFCITGICPAHGDRLFNPDGMIDLLEIAPNPVGDHVEIQIELIENYGTKLALYNVFGQEVKTLIDGTAVPGRHLFSFSTEDFSSGTYFVILETPTVRISRRMEIAK